MNTKRLAALLLASLTAVTITACAMSDKPAESKESAAATQGQTAAAAVTVDADASASIKGAAVPAAPSNGQSHAAVIYFSEPAAADKDSVQGTTQYVAQVIQEKTGADIFRIERQADYPLEYDAVTAQAKEEKENNVHPPIKDTIGDLSSYDTIFLGYPIWWYDAPMPVYSFLDQYDLSGKQVYIFVTHGGSGLSGTVSRIQTAEPGASVDQRGFAIYRTDVASDSPIQAWLGNLGF